ncbi:MAG: D-alanyl-D-alanine carboxypeptidase [Oscillibacter sp.]|jgi:D-alanyl-D-alanine carboxypeptidase (penicillin-binding protein 5/6)|nr:D-alanyl-D-alanine carboxypeptidase [Oscillibacter sp.]
MTVEEKSPALSGAERAERRRQRELARRERRRLRRRRRLKTAAVWLLAVLTAGALTVAGTRLARGRGKPAAPSASAPPAASAPEPETPWSVSEAADTLALGQELDSGYAAVVDADTGQILAEKDARTAVCPASMTKILTVLVAAEHVTDLDAVFTVPIEITDFCFSHDCSAVGFSVGERVSVRDLFYGTVLPSGADAAMSLAAYTAGSQETFVEWMNEKAAELGLSSAAHFTNCVGIYDPQHTCTVLDMAVILRAAEQNALCRQVLSAHTYTTSATAEHPQGIPLSNWFLRRIEDKDAGSFTVEGAKTGYVTQSGSCAASYGESGGRALLCVTAKASSAWRCIYDHAALYKRFSGE